MAAAPEEFLGQEGFLAIADPEPFSPSVFLDLPPTPRPDGGEDPASSDDLMLPFISRMLMEEGIDDKFFYQYPDHPALLTAQEPFAHILSAAIAAATFPSDANTTTNTHGSGNSTLSPSSSQFGPIELSQLLQSPLYTDMGLDGFTTDDVNAFLPAQDGTRAGVQQSPAKLGNTGDANAFLKDADEEWKKKTTTTLPACDSDHTALASALVSGQNGGDMDVLNLVFLKGMEEAKKFLPTNNNLLIHLEATSGEHLLRDRKLLRGFATGQVKKDGMPMFQASGNGRGHKNRHNRDDLKVEMGRNSKLRVPEPEETGEMVDNMIFNGYDLCLEKMKGLRIVMDSEAPVFAPNRTEGSVWFDLYTGGNEPCENLLWFDL